MNRKTAKTQTEPENVAGSNRKVLPPIQRSGSPGQVPAVHQSATLHQVTLPGTRSQMIQQLSEPASGIVTRPRCEVRWSHKRESKSMKLHKTKKVTNSEPITPDGEYPATVKSVAERDSDGQLEVVVEYSVVGVPNPSPRIYPATIEGRSPLWRDSKAILGRTLLTSEEDENGFDPAILTGRPCRVVVVHRPDGSGKLTAQVKLVLAPKAATPAVAAPAI